MLAWFPETADEMRENLRTLRSICAACPLNQPDDQSCLEYVLALEKGLHVSCRHGVWAGTTPKERAAMQQHGFNHKIVERGYR